MIEAPDACKLLFVQQIISAAHACHPSTSSSDNNPRDAEMADGERQQSNALPVQQQRCPYPTYTPPRH